jgi:hypothetical protein
MLGFQSRYLRLTSGRQGVAREQRTFMVTL